MRRQNIMGLELKQGHPYIARKEHRRVCAVRMVHAGCCKMCRYAAGVLWQGGSSGRAANAHARVTMRQTLTQACHKSSKQTVAGAL